MTTTTNMVASGPPSSAEMGKREGEGCERHQCIGNNTARPNSRRALDGQQQREGRQHILRNTHRTPAGPSTGSSSGKGNNTHTRNFGPLTGCRRKGNKTHTRKTELPPSPRRAAAAGRATTHITQHTPNSRRALDRQQQREGQQHTHTHTQLRALDGQQQRERQQHTHTQLRALDGLQKKGQQHTYHATTNSLRALDGLQKKGQQHTHTHTHTHATPVVHNVLNCREGF